MAGPLERVCDEHGTPLQKNGVCPKCYFRDWYRRNRDSVLARTEQRKRENRQIHLAEKRRWSERHRDVVREARRRGRVRAAGGDVVPYKEQDIYERDNWRCHVCGGQIDPKLTDRSRLSPTLDHLVAVSQGGSDTADNVRAAHKGCNSRRYWREQVA